MLWTLTTVCILGLGAVMFSSVKRKRDRQELELHTVTPEALYAQLTSKRDVQVFDVRQPLDLLADSEMIVGATRIPPRELLENPSLIPKEKDSVVYCTCPDDKTSRSVLRRAQSLHFTKVKFLKGGLAGWKAMGYPVERYDKPFRLDTRS
jgi:rhodanese-related sulfurtransferase